MAKSFGKGVGFGIGLLLLPNHFLSNSRLRQRPVPRAIGIIRDGSFSATAACLGCDGLKGGVSNPPSTLHKVERVVPNTLTGPRI